MPNHKNPKKNILIILILSLFFLTNLSLLFFQENIWWDSAVYIGMGKYAYSSGDSGLWEASRPLAWPLITGFFWKLGFGILFFRILSLFFAVACIYLVYSIAENIFNRKIALFSALFLAFSPTFYFFSTSMLSEMPSLFFALLSVYFFINKKYFFAGLLSGIAFMARFLQLFVFMALFIILLSYFRKDRQFFKYISKFLIGFLIILTPYLTLNYILYSNALYPFILQKFLTENTGFVFHQPFWFYFLSLLKENYLLIASIPGFYFLMKSMKNHKKSAIALIFLAYFIFLSFIRHKEMRIFMIAMPYLYIILAFSLDHVIKKIKLKNTLFRLFIILIFSIWLLQSFANIYFLEYNEINTKNKHQIFQDYLEKENADNIWISSPVSAVFSDKKINELIYYPAFNAEKFNQIKHNINHANHVLLDACDIACEPVALSCQEEKSEFLNLLKNNFNAVYYNKIGACEQFIFRK